MSDRPLSTIEVLIAEYEHQAKANGWGDLPENCKGGTEAFYKHLHERAKATHNKRPEENSPKPFKRAALCFSGGGIRSATFALGVLQGLARRGVQISQFHFLSTVSGGGYIGSWLSAWIHRQGIEQVQKDLSSSPKPAENSEEVGPALSFGCEPETIQHLRRYSNYMSPKFGLLSADTWTLVAIFSRNLLLNWTVLVPLILAFLLIPRLGMSVAHWARVNDRWFWLNFVAGCVCGAISIAYITVNRPSSGRRPKFLGIFQVPSSEPAFLSLGLLPLLVLAITSSVFWAWIHIQEPRHVINLPGCNGAGWCQEWAWWKAFVCFGMMVHFGGFLLSLLCPGKIAQAKSKSAYAKLKKVGFDVLYIIVTGGFGGACLWFVATKVFTFPPVAVSQHNFFAGMALFGGPSSETAGMHLDALTINAALYVCFAAPLFLLVFLLAATIYTGLASRFMDDADREWFARAGAWMLITIVLWTVVTVLVIFGPWALLKYGAAIKGPFFSLGTLTGALTLLGGWSGKTNATKQHGQKPETGKTFGGLIEALLPFSAPLFAAFLLVSMSLATSWALKFIVGKMVLGKGLTAMAIGKITWLLKLVTFSPDYIPQYAPLPSAGNWHLNVLYGMPTHIIVLGGIVLLVICGLAGFFINVNKFSLHGAYRDRLIRAYLGASRRSSDRYPNPFTGFDEKDNLRMYELATALTPRPLHIVNIALNLVAGKDLARQERKAESFTISPLHAGSHELGYRPSEKYACNVEGNPITLGTCLAISGAAASPNMGYHSSPVVTFLLALFNVRLGWWLGNPRERDFDRSSPRFAPIHLLAETLGLTDNRHKYVYLSDGGHFENLGLYEMVRRRCHYIVLSDASADCDSNFEDLGSAIRKIRIDMGVPIEFNDGIKIRPRLKAESLFTKDGKDGNGQYCALAEINYKAVDGEAAENGWLLYLKPTIYGSEPPDVLNYAKANPTFPHETTGDQMYSESQFESYRTLGIHAVNLTINAVEGKALKEMVEQTSSLSAKEQEVKEMD